MPKKSFQHSWLSNLYTTDVALLLSFEALSSKRLSCSILPNYETQASSCYGASSTAAKHSEVRQNLLNQNDMFIGYFMFRSLKPVPQFVIPPITAPPSSTDNSSPSEPSPKRLRLDDESASLNHEAQHSIIINNVVNALVTPVQDAQQPRTIEIS